MAFKKLLIELIVSVLNNSRNAKSKHETDLVIFKPDRLGDFLISAQAIHRIIQKYTGKRITIVVSEITKTLALKEFPQCDLLVLPRFKGNYLYRLLRSWYWGRSVLGNYQANVLINLRHHPTLLEDVILNQCNFEISFGMKSDLGGTIWPDNLRSFTPSVQSTLPESINNNSPREFERLKTILTSLQIDSKEYIPSLHCIEPGDLKYLLISPFGSTSNRTYPLEKLANSINGIVLPEDFKIILSGESESYTELQSLLEMMPPELKNKTTISSSSSVLEFVTLVASASIVVSVESAAAHFACAFKKPGVFILGGGHYGEFAPWKTRNNQFWLSNKIPCFRCDWNCIYDKTLCISEIQENKINKYIIRSLQCLHHKITSN